MQFRRYFLNLISSRGFYCLLLQLVFCLACVLAGGYLFLRFFPRSYLVLRIAAGLFASFLAIRQFPSEVKLSWLLLVCFFPVFTLVFWGLFGQKRIKKSDRKPHAAVNCGSEGFCNAANVLCATADCTPCTTESFVYFPTGEDFAKSLEDTISAAKQRIFLEFLVFSDGNFLNRLIFLLTEKARAGLDVRILYDEVGSMATLSQKSKDRLLAAGVRLRAFNRVKPYPDGRNNRRDHRKIAVVDQVAYTGGVNIADEYTNEITLFGYWKDTAVLIDGSAAEYFARSFLRLWSEGDRYVSKPPRCGTGQAVCVPFCDGFYTQAARSTFLAMIWQAKAFVKICTPYFCADEAFFTALTVALARGVRVEILIPAIPDKKLVFAMTKAFLSPLVKQGAHVRLMTGGFIHAKHLLTEDCGVVGSVNFDSRSLRSQYESGILLDKPECRAIVGDFDRVFAKSADFCPKNTPFLPFFTLLRALLPIL